MLLVNKTSYDREKRHVIGKNKTIRNIKKNIPTNIYKKRGEEEIQRHKKNIYKIKCPVPLNCAPSQHVTLFMPMTFPNSSFSVKLRTQRTLFVSLVTVSRGGKMSVTVSSGG